MIRRLLLPIMAILPVLSGLEAVSTAQSHPAAPGPIRFQAHKLASGLDTSSAGVTSADIDGDRNPEIIAWSNYGVLVFRNGSVNPLDCGLDTIRDVISISPGDFNKDGLPDLAVLTKADAELWINRKGRFEKIDVFIPEGAYNKAVWLDYDHDGNLDLLLLGDKSALLRNDGAAGFTNVSNNFPLVAGRALDGAVLNPIPGATATDLVVTYSDRPGVLYEDKSGSRYEAQDLNLIPAGARPVLAGSLTRDAAAGLVIGTESGVLPLFYGRGSFVPGARLPAPSRAMALIDVENRGVANRGVANRGVKDIAVSGAVYRNDGSGKFSEIKVPAAEASALTAVDFDGDGRTDLISIRPDGSLWFLRNETEK